MFDLIHEIGQTLRNSRLRTFLTGLAVAWGVFMLIILLGMARGVQNSFNEGMGSGVNNSINVWGGMTGKGYKGYKAGRRINLKDSDMDAVLKDKNNTNVTLVSTSASNDTAQVIGTKGKVSGFSAIFPKGDYEMERVTVTAGRKINDPDISNLRRSIMISEESMRTLFGNDAKPDEVLGKTLQSMGLSWNIVGVYSHRWQTDSYVPYTTYKAITGFDDNIDRLVVNYEGILTEDASDKAEERLRGTLAAAHSFDPEDKSAIWTWNRLSQSISSGNALIYLQWATWVIGIFTLLTGIVGVSNIMFVSVRERTHEIGIRRAIGAKPRSILTQILAEAVAITAISGYAGVFLGMLVLQVINLLFGSGEDSPISNPTVDISIAVQVTVVLVIAGALAGLLPALKAIKVKPVEALRDE